VSRVAGLLAIAILGVVVVAGFQSTLTTNLNALGINSHAKSSLIKHADRLADDPIPRGLTAVQHGEVQSAIYDAYMTGYRWAMLSCFVLCALSAVISGLMIKPEPVARVLEVEALAT
jgi:hypothetical protein